MLYCEYDSTISACCPSRVWLKYGVKRAAWLRRCLRENELVATLTYHAHDTCIYQVWALTFLYDLMAFAMNGPLFLHNKSWSPIWASRKLASDWLHNFYCVKSYIQHIQSQCKCLSRTLTLELQLHLGFYYYSFWCVVKRTYLSKQRDRLGCLMKKFWRGAI